MSEAGKLRLFTAVDIPPEWKSVIAETRDRLKDTAPNVKWVPETQSHITLVFLGSQAAGTLGQIGESMDKAASNAVPFVASLGRPGIFGSPNRVRVLWIGLASVPAGLELLHSTLTSAFLEESLGFDPKPLLPHVTLGRSRQGMSRDESSRLHHALQRVPAPPALRAEIDEIVLYESRLSPAGPEYLPVHRSRLGSSRG